MESYVSGDHIDSICVIYGPIVGGHLVMLNACLSHSWPDKSFRPRSRVAQLRPGTRAVKVRTLEAIRMCGEPMA